MVSFCRFNSVFAPNITHVKGSRYMNILTTPFLEDLEIIERDISPSIPWMSLLLLDRLSEILACWELIEPSTSSVAKGSEVTDAWEMLLWEEWLPPSKRLLKRILKRQKANTFIEEILVLLQRISYTFLPWKCSSCGVFIFNNNMGRRYWTPNLDVDISYWVQFHQHWK